MKKVLIFILMLLILTAFVGCGEKDGEKVIDDFQNDREEEISDSESVLQENTLEYSLSVDSSSYTVSGIGTFKESNLSIPSEYQGKPVTAIGTRAFENCDILETVEIPEGVEYISHYAFSSCTKLISVKLPESLSIIDDSAFSNCYSLESFSFPSGVKRIEETALNGCYGITQLTVDPSNPVYTSVDNCIIHIEDRMLEFGCCTSIIPTNGQLVAHIGQNAFNGITTLTEVTIPYNILDIGGNAFAGCTGLKEVFINDRVNAIGNGAFLDCTSLEKLTIGKCVTYISPNSFKGCNALTEIMFKNAEGWYYKADGDAEKVAIDVLETEKIIGYLISGGEQYLYCEK